MTISSNAWNIKTTTESDMAANCSLCSLCSHRARSANHMKYDGEQICVYNIYRIWKLARQWFNVHWSFRDIFFYYCCCSDPRSVRWCNSAFVAFNTGTSIQQTHCRLPNARIFIYFSNRLLASGVSNVGFWPFDMYRVFTTITISLSLSLFLSRWITIPIRTYIGTHNWLDGFSLFSPIVLPLGWRLMAFCVFSTFVRNIRAKILQTRQTSNHSWEDARISARLRLTLI